MSYYSYYTGDITITSDKPEGIQNDIDRFVRTLRDGQLDVTATTHDGETVIGIDGEDSYYEWKDDLAGFANAITRKGGEVEARIVRHGDDAGDEECWTFHNGEARTRQGRIIYDCADELHDAIRKTCGCDPETVIKAVDAILDRYTY